MERLDNGLAHTAVTVQGATAVTPFLPSGSVIRAKLAAMTETRTALLEYVAQAMEKGRHYYYMSELEGKSRKKDEKPALTQDGARTLSNLFETYPDAVKIEEVPLPDGHVRIRTTVALRSYTGDIRAYGIGVCSTKESRYAWRWVFDNQVPRHLDKGSLRTRTTQSKHVLYRVPNEDIDDVMNTVQKLSFKRGHTMAALNLPCVADSFEIGEAEEAEEEEPDHEAATSRNAAHERQAVLAEIYALLNAIPRGRTKAARTIFNAHIKGLPALPLDTLRAGLGRLRGFADLDHDWETDDLEATEARLAQKHRGDLFGDDRPLRTAESVSAVEDYRVLKDEGWRADLAALRASLATQPAFLAEVDKALHDARTAPGQGMHLLDSARAFVAEHQAVLLPEEG